MNLTPSGFINIIKPPGMTSHDAVAFVRRLCRQENNLFGINPKGADDKVGHLGTLDPGACGVLPIAVGSATKTMCFFPPADKEYIAELFFGAETDTLDFEGNITQRYPFEHITEESVIKALEYFQGEIMQVPPNVSALHVDGKRSYDLARKGKDFSLPPRPSYYKKAELLDFSLPKALIKVQCGPGTYVRSFARDLGKMLNSGAYLTFLLRTQSGSFTSLEAVTVEELKKDCYKYLLPVEKVLAKAGMPKYKMVRGVFQKGQTAIVQPENPEQSCDSGIVLLFSADDIFIGLGQIIEGSLDKIKIIFCR